MIYTQSYFLKSAPHIAIGVADWAVTQGTPFVFSLSSVYLVETDIDRILEILVYADVVIANEDEADAFNKVNDFKYKSRDEVANALA